MQDNSKFIADVEAFASKTADQMKEVFILSFNETLKIAQTPVAQGGDMPVADGFLRNSLTIEFNGSPVSKGGDASLLSLSGFQFGNPINAYWGSSDVGYAIPRHYMVGVGQGGGLWRDKAAQKWSNTVAKNARLVS